MTISCDFFHFRQEPVILGSLPGRPFELADSSKGFYDPNEIYPKYKEESDVNRLAVNLKNADNEEINPSLSLTIRRETRITGIPTADFNIMALPGSLFSGLISDFTLGS